MTDKIRWGILSTANIGRNRVIPAMQKASNGVVAAVASRDLNRAQQFADDLNIPTAYGSYEELIADPNIDAIYNPLPNSEHAEWSIRCAEAGKATLCEKPLASDAAEAQKMVDAFEQRGVLFAEAFMYRFHPQTQQVKAMIDSGAVGQVKVIRSSFTFVAQDENNIRLNASLAGGAVMDIGCYCINVMRFMTGEEPSGAKAFAQFGERSGVDEVMSGVLEFPSGVQGHFDCSLRVDFTNMYEIGGTEGTILVETGFVMPWDAPTIIRHWRGDEYSEIRVEPANHYTLMAEDFADALLNNRPPKFAPQDAVNNMRVIDQLYASARA